jgi:hypothetical protein
MKNARNKCISNSSHIKTLRMDVGIPELPRGLQTMESGLPDDPQQRDFDSLRRTLQGLFGDDEVVGIFGDAVEDKASACEYVEIGFLVC